MTDTALAPIEKLTRDVRNAATDLDPEQTRFVVDLYYQIQEMRKRLRNQERALHEGDEPAALVNHFAEQIHTLEKQIPPVMNRWTDSFEVGRWAKRQKGVGPVLAAGLLAHIDVTKAPRASSVWRYCGLDPSVEWKKGQRRPWNATLKTICVEPAQRVTTRRGHIPIADVCVGDEVLTHAGRWRVVTNTHKRWYEGTLHRVHSHASANQGPWLTDGHPIFVRRHPMMQLSGPKWKRRRWYKRYQQWLRAESLRQRVSEGATQRDAARELGMSDAAASLIVNGARHVDPPVMPETGWSPPEHIEPGWDVMRPLISADVETVKMHLGEGEDYAHSDDGHYRLARGGYSDAVAPRAVPVPAVVEVDERTARLIGLYLAEGHVTRNQTSWSFHIDEPFGDEVEQLIAQVLSLNAARSTSRANSAQQVHVYSKAIAEVFASTFGKGAYAKAMPADWVWRLGDAELYALLRGLFDGDGYKRHGRETLCTVSPILARQACDAIRRLGDSSSIAFDSSSGSHGAWRVMWSSGDSRGTERTPTGTWHPVTNVESQHYAGWVHNLEVGEDESYVVEGLATHNCWRISDSFVKQSGSEDCFYGQIYRDRKAKEVERDNNGANAEEAARTLATRNIQAQNTRSYYEAGYLPPGRLDLRARRYAVKLFLSHYWTVAYREQYGVEPPMPYAIEHLGHSHYIAPPE